ncbi:MAG TPA: hypothetical protein VFF81_01720 [Noviherbaspirillum sp.]|nr:hypothetical protein [Noviherbaspirillum sp.]
MDGPLDFSGTPVEVGYQIWDLMCEAAVRIASNDSTPNEIAQLYSAFLWAAMCSLAAEFGKELAVRMVNSLADELETTDIGSLERVM